MVRVLRPATLTAVWRADWRGTACRQGGQGETGTWAEGEEGHGPRSPGDQAGELAWCRDKAGGRGLSEHLCQALLLPAFLGQELHRAGWMESRTPSCRANPQFSSIQCCSAVQGLSELRCGGDTGWMGQVEESNRNAHDGLNLLIVLCASVDHLGLHRRKVSRARALQPDKPSSAIYLAV